MENIVSKPDHRPAKNLVFIYEIIFILVSGKLGVFPHAVFPAVAVDNGLTLKQTADCSSFRCHNCRNCCDMRPSGHTNQVGHNTDHRHSSIYLCYTVNHIGHRCSIRHNGSVANVKRNRVISRTIRQQLHDTDISIRIIAVIENAVIGILFQQRLLFCAVNQHLSRYFQGVCNRVDRQGGLSADNRKFLCFYCFRHRGEVKDIAENRRLAAKQLEVGVHEFTERVLLPVVGKAELFDCLVPAGRQYRRIGFCRLTRRMDGRSPHNKWDAYLRLIRRTDRCGLFVYANAKSCHSLPHFPASF